MRVAAKLVWKARREDKRMEGGLIWLGTMGGAIALALMLVAIAVKQRRRRKVEQSGVGKSDV